ncbi:MAG: D-hexose-6-phosphate mutarotase [Pontibacterium sp.]
MDVSEIINSLEFVSLSDSSQEFSTPQVQPILVINHPACTGSIALQGAQVLSYKATGGNELIWLSPCADFTPGASIQGGIPICLPWFGDNRHYASQLKHGFVRNRAWQLTEAHENSKSVTLSFMYKSTMEDLTLFPHPFISKITVSFGHTLSLHISVTHDGKGKMPLSWALHSYFMTEDIGYARVSGLEGFNYLDNTLGLSTHTQTSTIEFNGEFDRVYECTPDTVVISGHPTIRVNAESQPTTIVWNPGAQLARKMKDIGEDNHRNFLCVERGAAFGDEVILASGESVEGSLTISESM